MFALLHSLTMFVIDFFKSSRRLEAENLFLRHQLSIALRRAPPRLRLRGRYLGHLIFMIGLALTFRSWFALILLAARTVWFNRRVLADKWRLEARFGADYAAYR